MQFPAWSLGSDPANTVPQHAVRRAGRRPEAAEDGGGGDEQVPVDPVHERRRARGAEEARPDGGAVPRVGLRQPRLRPDRQPHQGRQARLRLGRRHRPGRQPAARRDEEDRLRAAAALLPVPGAGTAGHAAGGEERAVGDDLRGAAAVHLQPGRGRVRQALPRARRPRPASPTPSVEMQAAASYTAWQILEAGVDGDQEPGRQGDRRLAEGEPGRHHPGQAALRRHRQLRRRPDAHQAGAERQVGRGLAEGSDHRRRQAARATDARAPHVGLHAAERHAAGAEHPLGRLRRRALRPARAGPEPELGAAAADQPGALRLRLPRRLPVLPDGDAGPSTRC